MTSRKYFLGITAMMLVLFFMFMFSETIKSSNSGYSQNDYAKVTPIFHEDNAVDADSVKVQYVGSDTDLEYSVYAWCRYTKKQPVDDGGAIIVVDSKSLNDDTVTELKKKADKGAVLIFAGFPDSDFLKKNDTLMSLMGISEVKSDSQEILGAYLYDGFLVGGEKIYLPENEEDEEYNDLSASVPWIVTGKGTETYMSGLTSDSVEEKSDGSNVVNVEKDSPALIWRAVTDNTVAFVIYDDFIDEQSILGVLEACEYEASDYTLYPVVNSSVYTVSDFALLSEENSATIESIYSRTTQSLVKEIIWPRLMSLAKRDNLVLSCYFNTRLRKETELSSNSNFSFFLREMWDIAAEAGISGNSLNDSLAEKLLVDLTFYRASESGYSFTSLYLDSLPYDGVETVKSVDKDIYSLVIKDKGNCDYADANDDVIIDAVTQDASVYSYRADFAYRSLASCIGYSNVQIDMERIMQPASTADEWQNYSEVISDYLSNYWCKLSRFENVTASEAAGRTAAFLENPAVSTIKGRTIAFTANEPGYYLLRTHNEKITNIKNASFTYLEEDIYLITVTNTEEVQITVESHN